jgi:hypothetical protein
MAFGTVFFSGAIATWIDQGFESGAREINRDLDTARSAAAFAVGSALSM